MARSTPQNSIVFVLEGRASKLRADSSDGRLFLGWAVLAALRALALLKPLSPDTVERLVAPTQNPSSSRKAPPCRAGLQPVAPRASQSPTFLISPLRCMSSAPSSRTEPSNLEAERTGTQQAGNHGDGIQHQTSAGSRGEGGLSVGAASFTPGAAGGIGDFEPPAAGAAIISGASQGHGQGRHGRNGRGRGGLSRELQAHGHSRSDGGGRHSRGRGGGRRHEDASAVGSTTGGGLPAVKPAAQSGQALHEGVMGSSPGRRGFLNANHLLGFQTSRRDGESGGGRGGGRGARGPGGRGLPRRPPPKPQPYDRNKFLQVGCPRRAQRALHVSFRVLDAAVACAPDCRPRLPLGGACRRPLSKQWARPRPRRDPCPSFAPALPCRPTFGSFCLTPWMRDASSVTRT